MRGSVVCFVILFLLLFHLGSDLHGVAILGDISCIPQPVKNVDIAEFSRQGIV